MQLGCENKTTFIYNIEHVTSIGQEKNSLMGFGLLTFYILVILSDRST